MIKIYHVKGTRSMRPIWVAFELGIDIDIETIDFSSEFRDSEQWRAISPAGKVPALTDGELTMFESGAMVEYVLDRYGEGRLRPQAGTREGALYQQWSWFSEATLLRPLGLMRILRGDSTDGPTMPDDAKEKTETCLAVVDRAVAGREFLLDEFTAADVMMGYALHLVANVGVLDERYPEAVSYLARLRQRDAFKRTATA